MGEVTLRMMFNFFFSVAVLSTRMEGVEVLLDVL